MPIESSSAGKFFRLEGRRPDPFTLNMHMNFGGLGDYICRIPALRIFLEQSPHVRLKLWGRDYFLPLAEYFLDDLKPQISFHSDSNIEKDFKAIRGELFKDFRARELLPLAIDLVEQGFLSILNRNSYGPEERQHPRFLGGPDVSSLVPKGPYVVLCTGFTSKTRAWLGVEIDRTIKGILKRGYVPVLLGKKVMVPGKYSTYYTTFSTEGTVDLREKTDVLQAAEVIRRARAILGVDNGLIHLAGCTDTDIVAGFTTVRPEHRTIIRPRGRLLTVTPPEDLKCRFCQSNLATSMHGGLFSECFYGDLECLKSQAGEKFLRAFDSLSET